jgi:hypothetical protein
VARFTFALSALLTTAGVAAGLLGIAAGEFKPFAVGFVLLAGAAVFALLYVGTRRGILVTRPTPTEES